MSPSNPSPVGPKVEGSVKAVEADGAGGWYIGGSFTAVGGVARKNLAHVLADGTLDAAWSADANGEVKALLRSGSTLYVAGAFTQIGTQTHNRLAALDSAGAPTSWAPSLNATVNAIALSGTTLYAGGEFTTVTTGPTTTVTRNHTAAFDTTGSGTLTSWDPNINSDIYALAVSGSTVYIGGWFMQVGGQTRNGLAAVSSSTGALTGWNPDMYGGAVYALEVGSGVIYAGGAFTKAGGSTGPTRLALAAISTSTGAATSWNPGVTDITDSPSLSQAIYTMDLSGGTLYVGGNFYYLSGAQTFDDLAAAGQERLNVGAIDIATAQPTSWELAAGSYAYAVAAQAGKLYVGGSFSSVGGAERRYLAEIDQATGRPTSWHPRIVGSWVNSVAISGQTVYVGGDFSSIAGQTRNNIGALDATSGSPTSFNPNSNDEVDVLALSGSTLYVAGYWMDTIGGQSRNGIAALSTSTGLATSWNPAAGYPQYESPIVKAIVVSGSTVYLGGGFSWMGASRANLAAVDAGTGQATSWNPSPSDWVNSLALNWPTLYAGGSFTSIGGQPRQHLAALDLANGQPTGFAPPVDAPVDALALSGSVLYAGGDFEAVGGQARHNLAGLDSTFGTTTSWNPTGGGNYVNALATVGDNVYAGGSGVGSGGSNGFAVFSSDPISTNSPQITGTPSVGQTLTVSNGTWEGDIQSYRYQWLRDGAAISGAASNTYALTSTDSTHAIGARVTASTLGGSAVATADPVSVGSAPVNTAAPRISGAPSVGQTLTAARGSWAGVAPLTYTYQWQRCESTVSCASIAGATDHRYVLTSDDLGKTISVVVGATNSAGSASATSAQTGAIAPARSSTTGPLGGAPGDPVGPVAGVDPLASAGSGYVAAVEQPDVSHKPVFADYFKPAGSAFAEHGVPGDHVSTAVGSGLVFVGSQKNSLVYAFNATTLAESYRFSAPSARGIAYANNELYVIKQGPGGNEVGVYDATTGTPKRTLVPPLAGTTAAAGIKDVTGVSVSFGEAWLTFAGSRGGGGVMILDALTGALKAVTWNFGRYDCSVNQTTYTTDPGRCLSDASAGTGAAEPGWWDIATAPDLNGAFVGCRFTNRDLLFSALATDDVYVGDATLSSDCAAGRYVDPNGNPNEARGPVDGMYAVPGMGWVLAMGTDSSGDAGSYVREYDAGSALASLGAAELNLARSWRPRDARSNNSRDISYLNRDTQINWSGDLTQPDWQRGNRCLGYTVSDADIYVIGWRGEHWYEPARGFTKIDAKIDGQVKSTLTTPVGNWCFDLDSIPSGTHDVTLTATVDGKQVSITNATLKVDHDVPYGTADDPGRFIKGTVKITGSLSDDHSGPRDWQPQAQPGLGGAPISICDPQPDPGPYACSWDTTETSGGSAKYPDGTYALHAQLRDRLEASHGGPNSAQTVSQTVTVDNTPPQVSLSGDLPQFADVGAVVNTRTYPLVIDAQDAGSGVVTAEILVDDVQQHLEQQTCAQGGCSLNYTYSFVAGNYTEGAHSIQVIVTDQVGWSRTTNLAVYVDSILPGDGVTDSPDPNDGSGSAPSQSSSPSLSNGSASTTLSTGPDKLLPCTESNQPANFTVYSLGSSFEGMAASSPERRCDTPDARDLRALVPGSYLRANYVSYIYGDCTIPPDADPAVCSPPLEIQTWPICERNATSYPLPEWVGVPDLPRVPTDLNGVPAALFDDVMHMSDDGSAILSENQLDEGDGLQIELYTGDSTIVIFANDADVAKRAVTALRSESTNEPPGPPSAGPASVGDALPEPLKGAMRGALSCTDSLVSNLGG